MGKHNHTIADKDIGTLNAELHKIDPQCEAFMSNNNTLWIRRTIDAGGQVTRRSAPLWITLAGDLATGKVRRMGWSDEQRRAIAQCVLQWRK